MVGMQESRSNTYGPCFHILIIQFLRVPKLTSPNYGEVRSSTLSQSRSYWKHLFDIR